MSISNELSHSYKGSTWKDHKYVKRENGRYYYPDERSNKGDRYQSDYRDGWAGRLTGRYRQQSRISKNPYYFDKRSDATNLKGTSSNRKNSVTTKKTKDVDAFTKLGQETIDKMMNSKSALESVSTLTSGVIKSWGLLLKTGWNTILGK